MPASVSFRACRSSLAVRTNQGRAGRFRRRYRRVAVGNNDGSCLDPIRTHSSNTEQLSKPAFPCPLQGYGSYRRAAWASNIHHVSGAGLIDERRHSVSLASVLDPREDRAMGSAGRTDMESFETEPSWNRAGSGPDKIPMPWSRTIKWGSSATAAVSAVGVLKRNLEDLVRLGSRHWPMGRQICQGR